MKPLTDFIGETIFIPNWHRAGLLDDYKVLHYLIRNDCITYFCRITRASETTHRIICEAMK